MKIMNIRKGIKHSFFNMKAQVLAVIFKYDLLDSLYVTVILDRIYSTLLCTKCW